MTGLDGTLHGSCIVCLNGTDTGLAFVGEPEWAIAGLSILGVEDDVAKDLVLTFCEEEFGCEPGTIPGVDITFCVRVCAACSGQYPVGLVAIGLPGVGQPDHLRSAR